jgi:hypothetical protein
MTIRLLAAYGSYACNAIVTLDAATETGLVASGQATTNLAGGVPASVGVVQTVSFRQTFVIGQMSTPVTAPADAAENTLYALTIPGGLLGPNDVVRVTARLTCANSANSKLLKLKHGSNVLFSAALASLAGYNMFMIFGNKGDRGSQWVGSSQTGNTGTNLTYSVDTLQDHTISLSVSKAVPAETAVLESVLIELLCGG